MAAEVWWSSGQDLIWRFGEIESILANYHGISDSKRSTFASRLKHFHRLKFPFGFKAEHGKPSKYKVGDLVLMALALELTALGLGPERVVRVLSLNWYAVSTAVRMAATSLTERPLTTDALSFDETDPLAMFLFFDPSGLAPLTGVDLRITPDLDEASDTFFYGGAGIVRESITRWTSGFSTRIALVNVTSMLMRLVDIDQDGLSEAERALVLSYRISFFKSASEWADKFEECFFSEDAGAEARLGYLETYARNFLGDDENGDPASFERTILSLRDQTGIDPETIRAFLMTSRGSGRS